jgi:flavin reductase (DIM6/NTAB) family NADH-FMN oxidoreductase RutF
MMDCIMDEFTPPAFATVPVDADTLRHAMRKWATGVAVVTSVHEDGAHGMTATSFTSVSLTPPQILISLALETRTYKLLKGSRIFAVSLLGAGQERISDRFAGRLSDDEDRLAGLDTFTMVTGAPLLRDAIAHFDCRVIATFTSGTHSIFIGEVMAAQSHEEGQPLVYYDRAYRTLR